MRRQFLPYFLDGRLIGECLLAEEPDRAHATAYVLPDRALLIVMNEADTERTIPLRVNLAPWLPCSSGTYEVRSFDMSGRPLETSKLSAPSATLTTPELPRWHLALYEISPR